MPFLRSSKQKSYLLAAFFLLMGTFCTQISAQKIFALSGNSLLSFDANTPGTNTTVGTISGIAAGQVLAGIDFRPQTGELYGIGYNAATGEARVYTINITTAAATAIGAAPITVVPTMGEISFDFNPTVDRIRFMGSNNANYRLHPVLGTLVATDGNLAFNATDVNTGQDPEVGTSAYTNSYIAATATTLFNYDTKLNVLTSQIPPNNGTLNTIGASGIMVNTTDPSADMDGYFDPQTGLNTFFLAANIGSATTDNLYTINTQTGQATLKGSLGAAISDIAIQIDRTVPALTGDLAYALTATNWLVSFDAANPGVIRTATAISGVVAGQVLAGLDFRPATGQLYGLGYNATTGEATLYTLQTATAVATPIGIAPIAFPANLTKINMDFNPTVDRIRVTTNGGNNYRLHPVTGVLVATDTNLSYSPSDPNTGQTPSIGTVAYTNSFMGTTSTTLYCYDDLLNILAIQNPPNDGVLNTVGASGIVLNTMDQSGDLDIYYDSLAAANRAYLIVNLSGSNSDQLYRINLMTAAATSIGLVGNGLALRDIAITKGAVTVMPVNFVAALAGRTEVPPVASLANGTINASLTGNTLKVSGSFANLSGAFDVSVAEGAHIHLGMYGSNGGIQFTLTPVLDVDMKGGIFLDSANTFTLSNAQVLALQNRELYINIHSTTFPSGELRGQLVLEGSENYAINLSGNNENPVVLTQANGGVFLELTGNKLVATGTFSGLSGEFDENIAGGSHLHIAPAGSNGSIALELKPTVSTDKKSGNFTAAENTFTLTMDQIAALKARGIYANIHTTAYTSGELRGQAAGSAANILFRAYLSGTNEVQTVLSRANGQVLAELKGDTLIVSGSFAGMSSTVVAAHLHAGLTGSNGPVDIELTPMLDTDGKSGVFTSVQNTFVLSAAQVETLLNRGMYVNIHTQTNTAGELRGQCLPENQAVFTAYLSGNFEVNSVLTRGHGMLKAELSGKQLTVSGSASDMSSEVFAAYLHLAAAGSNGDVAFPLVLDPNIVNGAVFSASNNRFTLSDEQIEALLARGCYVSIQSLAYAGGELRGQLLHDANAYFMATLSGTSEVADIRTAGSGAIALELNGTQLICTGSFNDLSGNSNGGAHLHTGAAGANGAVVVHLEPQIGTDQVSAIFDVAENIFTVSTGFIDTLMLRGIYANMHSVAYPAGELRGQCLPMATSYFTSTFAGINSVQPVTTTGSGALKIELTGDLMVLTGTFANLSGNFDANIGGGSHLHFGDAGSSGVLTLQLKPIVGPDLKSGRHVAADNTFTLAEPQIDALYNGELYYNIHTTTNPDGEIRGQILQEVNFFPNGGSSIIAPLPGTSIALDGLAATIFEASWIPSSDLDGNAVVYIWQVAADSAFNTILFQQNTGNAEKFSSNHLVMDALLAANGISEGALVNLYHRVVVSDGCNQTVSDPAPISLRRATVGTNDPSLQGIEMSVFPNPATETDAITLGFNSTDSHEVLLTLMDATGRICFSQTLQLGIGKSTFTLPQTAQLPNGIYFVRVQNELSQRGMVKTLSRI